MKLFSILTFAATTATAVMALSSGERKALLLFPQTYSNVDVKSFYSVSEAIKVYASEAKVENVNYLIRIGSGSSAASKMIEHAKYLKEDSEVKGDSDIEKGYNVLVGAIKDFDNLT
ncbi:hypothetical protein LPJ66_006373 [Kickxella alabastrina]|uniref:Uncharacterized protein n=1 Tax=Kickxella alabastrina TaxID=61397 RepID=A0ACC1IEA2_9FUNG|nr:hypothetical protein LPJ66_006373 [Kickxella alabastrina]